MSRFLLTFALAAGLVAAAGYSGTGVMADDKKPDDKKAEEKAPVITPETKALSALAAAYKMVDYGREKQVPEALILAARVIGTTDTQKPDPKKVEKPKKEVPDYDEREIAIALIKEALAMTSADEAVKSLAKRTEKEIAEGTRGRKGGPTVIPGTMRGDDDFDTFRITFEGGKVAEIIIRVEPSIADVDLRVIDNETGRVVAFDRRADDDCFVRWTPNKTKQYTVELRNYKRKINVRYNLYTN